MTAHALAVVGASWGGFFAVGELLAALDDGCGLAIAIAQHRAADAPADAWRLRDRSRTARPGPSVSPMAAITVVFLSMEGRG